MAKRKVFQTHLGFYDTVIATFSQKSALAAWNSKQDLFKEGLAKVVDDPAIIKQAMDQPGRVLRRPAGSDIAFSLNPPLPKVPKRKK